MKAKKSVKQSKLPKIERIKSHKSLGYSYYLYPPSPPHEVFRIIKRYKPSGRLETVKNAELEKLNDSLINKQISVEVARAQARQIRDSLYAADGVAKPEQFLNRANGMVLERYWAFISIDRPVSDALSAKAEFRRALLALGTLELETATQSKLQKHLDDYLPASKHGRVVVKLNTLLKFLGRGFKLAAKERPEIPIKYITLDEFKVLLTFIPDERIRLLHEVAFYTGCLRGEATGLDQRSYSVDKDTIRIVKQVDRAGVKRASSMERTTVVLPEGRDALIKWFRVRASLPLEKQLRVSLYTKKASHKAFPDSPSKQITFNDLRHSYAVHLLSLGVPLGLVAEFLGIGQAAAKALYGQFGISEDSISLTSRILRSKSMPAERERVVSLTSEVLDSEQMSDKTKSRK